MWALLSGGESSVLVHGGGPPAIALLPSELDVLAAASTESAPWRSSCAQAFVPLAVTRERALRAALRVDAKGHSEAFSWALGRARFEAKRSPERSLRSARRSRNRRRSWRVSVRLPPPERSPNGTKRPARSRCSPRSSPPQRRDPCERRARGTRPDEQHRSHSEAHRAFGVDERARGPFRRVPGLQDDPRWWLPHRGGRRRSLGPAPSAAPVGGEEFERGAEVAYPTLEGDKSLGAVHADCRARWTVPIDR